MNDLEFRLRIYPRPLPRKSALAIFSINEITNELTDILVGTGLEYQPEVELTGQQWSDFITLLVSCFGPLPATTAAVRHALEGTDRQLVAALGQRILKTIEALHRLPGIMGKNFPDEVVLLLPATFAQRLDMLIGEGRLPIAQITQFDVLRF